MKIATLNIDWAHKQSSKTHILKVEEELNNLNADILIVTECVDSLKLPGYNYVYKTKAIPSSVKYEELNYTEYLKGETAIRVSIFSKYESIRSFLVTDEHNSICEEFNTGKGALTIYATIVGTRFNKMPFAKNELDNCVSDYLRISQLAGNLCLAGDLNTSFDEKEVDFEIKHIKSRQVLVEMCRECNLNLTTKNIPVENIDHILLPVKFSEQFNIKPNKFVEKGILSDHMGIVVEIN